MPQFFYVYILRSQRDGHLYIGSTTDLRARLQLQNTGEVTSTKSRWPLDLIFYEAYLNEYDAKRREQYFKSTKGKTTLRTMLKDFFNAVDSRDEV